MKVIATHEGTNPPTTWRAGDGPTINVMGRVISMRREIRRTGPQSWAYVLVAHREDRDGPPSPSTL